MSESGINVVSDASETGIDSVVRRFLDERQGSRGVDTYEWLVGTLRRVPNSHSHVISVGSAAAVVTSCDSSVVVHCIVGPDDERAALIAHIKVTSADTHVRGLALPGDRMTKNLFEEARMPAQVLIH